MLTLAARVWIGWVGLIHAALAYFAWSRPDLLETPAYSWATGILPLQSWAVVSACVAALIAYGLVTRRIFASLLGLGLALPTQVVFGLSIFILSFEGTISAVIGAAQWWSVAVGNGCLLYALSIRQPSDVS